MNAQEYFDLTGRECGHLEDDLVAAVTYVPNMAVALAGIEGRQKNGPYLLPRGWQGVNTGTGGEVTLGQEWIRRLEGSIEIAARDNREDEPIGWYWTRYTGKSIDREGPYGSLLDCLTSDRHSDDPPDSEKADEIATRATQGGSR